MPDTRIYRPGKPYFIDKMPNNFRHIGLIHLMLPNAKIIDARREPMACCFSNLKQLFATGPGVQLRPGGHRSLLPDLSRTDGPLERSAPGRVLRVQHEDVVEDLEGSVRRILDYCGLPFEPACVEFHKTRAQRTHRRAPSRSAGRSSARASTSGATSSRGSDRCAQALGQLAAT